MKTCICLGILLLIPTLAEAAANPASPPIAQFQVLSESDDELVVQLDLPDFISTSHQKDGISQPGYELFGEGALELEGLPPLPTLTRFIIAPAGAQVTAAAVTSADQSDVDITLSDSETASLADSIETVKLGNPANYRGFNLVPVTINPIKYDNSSGKLNLLQSLEVRFSFEMDAGQNSDTAVDAIPKRLTQDSYRYLRSLTMNPPLRDHEAEVLPRGGYLIIGGSAANGNQARTKINQLADWHRATGRYVEVNTNVTQQNQIRQLIRDAWDNWDPPLDHVCLVGGWNDPQADETTADIYYGLLEGNDHLSEVSVSRISTPIETAIDRILAYQTVSNRNNPNWMRRAGAAEEQVSGWLPSVGYLVHWIAETERRVGFDFVGTHYYSENDGSQAAGSIGNWLSQGGLSVCFTRGRPNVNFPNNSGNTMFFIASGHSENYMSSMWQQGSTGPSAVSSTWHNPATQGNNALIGGMARGLLVDEMPLGWARALAMTLLDYGGMGSWGYYDAYFTIWGDPAQRAWLGRASVIGTNAPASVKLGSNRLDISVLDPDREVSIPGALVTLTQPGRLLYWTYTDEHGNGVLPLDPENEDDLIVTITKDRHLPYQRTIDVSDQGVNLTGEIVEIDDSEGGNNNGILNPGETVLLTLSVHNHSNQDWDSEIRGVVQSTSPFVEVENREVHFPGVEGRSDTRARETVRLTVSPVTPEDADLGLYIELNSDNGRWRNTLHPEFASHHLVLESYPDGSVIDPGITQFDLIVKNRGTQSSPELSARLQSLQWEIRALDPISTLGAIAPNRTGRFGERRFRLNCSGVSVPGSIVPMRLLLYVDEDQAADTLFFDLTVGGDEDAAPYPPDDYGYVCLDDTDDDWFAAPAYNWIEICPNEDEDYNGTRIQGQGQDYAAEIELPFDFLYYGERYRHITVCENGFMALGEGMEVLKQNENYPLDQMVGGAPGMLAPLWDDLSFSNQGGIYYYYIRNQGMFVVEWYNSKFSSNNANFHFQIILYDPQEHPSVTGDGNIKFQYRGNIPEVSGGAPSYCSVGICSPTGRFGINYLSARRYHPSSAPLANRRALLFTTSTQNPPATLFGRVTDARTDDGVPEVTLLTEQNFAAVTDEDGYYLMDNVPAMIEFWLHASKPDYNDSTKFNFYIDEFDTLEVNFNLLHPEFTPSPEFFSHAMDSGRSVQFSLQLDNTGNGPLDWTMEKRLLGEFETPPWQMRSSIPVGERLDDSRIEGVAFVNGEFYLSGNANDQKLIYVLNREGELQRTFPQFGDARWGYYSITFDGDNLWCAGGDTVYCLSTRGDLLASWRAPIPTVQAITWDPIREILWLSGITSRYIWGYTREGVEVEVLDRFRFYIYGLAYWYDDPDGYPLYISNVSVPDYIPRVHKYNPDTQDTLLVSLIMDGDSLSNQTRGCYITNELDIYSWVMLLVRTRVPEQGGDLLEIWQIDARKDWFQLDANRGHIDAGERSELNLTLDAATLPMALFESELRFFHNAEGGSTIIPITLDVVGSRRPTAFDLAYPADGDTLASNTVLFGWDRSVDYNDDDSLYYEMWLQSGLDSLCWSLIDTTIALQMDLVEFDDLLSPDLLWWVNAISGDDTVRSASVFSFFYPPYSTGDDATLPVEFGIQDVRPNPFNSSTAIRYGVDRDADVQLKIFDLQGRQVADLSPRGQVRAGYQHLVWDASAMPSGLFILQLHSAGRTDIRKLALVR